MQSKGKWFILCLATGLLMAAGVFVFASDYEDNAQRFVPGTTINGVDCSGMSVEEAEEALTNARNGAVIAVEEKGNKLASITDLGLSYDIHQPLDEIIHSSILRMDLPESFPGNAHKEKEVPMVPVEMPEKLHDSLVSYDFLDREYSTKTADAYVDLSNFAFNIQPEVQGDNIDPERFAAAVMKAVERGETSLEFRPEDYYELPGVTKDDEELLDYQKYCKENLSQKITLKFFDGEETIMPETLKDLKVRGEDGSVQLDKDAVKSYAIDMANNHSTVGGARSFTTAKGKTIEVIGGDYGYVVDADAEVDQLIKDLESNEDVSREPIYSSEPYGGGKGVNGDIGDSYAEVDINNQKLYLFVDGKEILSCDVVTGNEPRHATPSGVYQVDYTDRKARLRGLNDDGTKYDVPVDYWMPFNGGIGMHDIKRSAWGGNIYRSGGGSHGCVNMPYAAAQETFQYVKKGFPVVVYRY